MLLNQVVPTGTGAENRREIRSIWTRQIDGELFLNAPELGDIHHVVLRDVSSNGASLTLETPLVVGTSVSIVLKTNDMRMSFMATVAWCSTVRDPAMLVGHSDNATVHAVGLHIRGSGSFSSMLKACQVHGPLSQHPYLG